ncbi:MAG: recombinase family protein [Dehalococcoidia bacterium]
MRAVAYVVFDPGASPASPASRPSQEGEVVRFCQLKSHSLTTVFSDSNRSGLEDREGLIRMVQYIQEQPGEFLVIVTDPGHLGTTLEEAVDAVLKVDSLGSRVVCTIEGLPDPLQGLFRTLSAAGPGAERRQHIREAMENKAFRGEGLGRPPYGYCIGKDRRLEEVPQEAELVRLVFRLYLEENLGVRSIARYLNQHGYRTRRDGNWSAVTLWDILRNRVYIGTYNRFGMRLLGNHEPLVPPETFRRAQDLMKSRSPLRRAATVQPFLLSGLVYCVQCGNRMIGVTRRQMWRRKDGRRMRGTYRYYQCQSRTNQSRCQYHTWRAAELEGEVGEQLRRQIQQSQDLVTGKRVPAHHAQETGRVERQSRRKRRYMAYMKQAADGTMSLGRLRFLLNGLPAVSPEEKEGEDLVPTGSEQDSVSSIRTILDPTLWEGLEHQARRRTLQRWIDRVTVGDKEVEVRLRQS